MPIAVYMFKKYGPSNVCIVTEFQCLAYETL